MLVCRIRKQQGKLYCKASEWPLWDAKLAKASQPQSIVTNHQAPTALHTLLFCLMAKQVQIRRPSYPVTTWHPSPWFPSEKFSHSTAYLAVLPDGKASANPATLLPSNNMTSVRMVSKWKNFQNIKYYGWLLIVPVPEDLGVVKSFDEVIYSHNKYGILHQYSMQQYHLFSGTTGTGIMHDAMLAGGDPTMDKSNKGVADEGVWIGKQLQEQSTCTNHRNRGRTSADRSTEATLMLTVPRSLFKSSTKDLTWPSLEIVFRQLVL